MVSSAVVAVYRNKRTFEVRTSGSGTYYILYGTQVDEDGKNDEGRWQYLRTDGTVGPNDWTKRSYDDVRNHLAWSDEASCRAFAWAHSLYDE